MQIERATNDDAEDLAERIRQRLTNRPAVASPPPPPAANPPFVLSVTAGAPQLAGAAPQVVREVIERQIVVMRCAHCGELTPVDLSRCKNCGASIST